MDTCTSRNQPRLSSNIRQMIPMRTRVPFEWNSFASAYPMPPGVHLQPSCQHTFSHHELDTEGVSHTFNTLPCDEHTLLRFYCSHAVFVSADSIQNFDAEIWIEHLLFRIQLNKLPCHSIEVEGCLGRGISSPYPYSYLVLTLSRKPWAKTVTIFIINITKRRKGCRKSFSLLLFPFLIQQRFVINNLYSLIFPHNREVTPTKFPVIWLPLETVFIHVDIGKNMQSKTRTLGCVLQFE